MLKKWRKNRMKINDRKKTIPIFGTLFIVFLLISTVTAVPQQNAEIINEQIDKKAQLEQFVTSINTFEDSLESSTMYMSFLLNIADILLSEIETNPDSIGITETMIYNAIPTEKTTADDVTDHAMNTLENLQKTVTSIKKSSDSSISPMDIPLLETLISLLISFIKNLLSNDSPTNGGNNSIDWLSILKNILGVLASVLSIIIKGILNGISLLIGGILRIIGALITIVVLLLAGLQTTLAVGAFFLVFMGFISKIGIKAVSIIAAPIFALLAAQFSISMGSLLGGLSMALHAVLAFALFFAIPLLIVAAVILLLGDNSGDDDDGSFIDFSKITWDGPLYMILSIFINAIKG
jgi:hypothetical protein